MKNAQMNISHFGFILFNLTIFGEIVTTFKFLFVLLKQLIYKLSSSSLARGGERGRELFFSIGLPIKCRIKQKNHVFSTFDGLLQSNGLKNSLKQLLKLC